MADFNGTILSAGTLLQATPGDITGELVGAPSSNDPVVTYSYFMIWSDPDCVPPVAKYWYATIEDPTGTQYLGPKCGATPITGASVLKRFVQA